MLNHTTHAEPHSPSPRLPGHPTLSPECGTVVCGALQVLCKAWATRVESIDGSGARASQARPCPCWWHGQTALCSPGMAMYANTTPSRPLCSGAQCYGMPATQEGAQVWYRCGYCDRRKLATPPKLSRGACDGPPQGPSREASEGRARGACLPTGPGCHEAGGGWCARSLARSLHAGVRLPCECRKHHDKVF